MQGWIKDHRQELDSDIWLMPPIYHRVWQYIKYMANHQDNEIPMRDGSKLQIKKGQHLTSVRTIAQKVGWYERGIFKEPNPKTIQSVLTWLEESNMIYTEKSNRKYTLITVVNWAFYQGSDDMKVTESNSVEVTVGKQSMDINKNDENEKNLKNISSSSDDGTQSPQNEFDVFWDIYVKKVDKKKATEKFKAKRKQYSFDEIIAGTKRYMHKCEAEGTEKKYIKGPAVFLNGDCFLEEWEIYSEKTSQINSGPIDFEKLEAMLGE